MPLISVIVPVYKVEPYLRECVDSILNQTFTDFELILVDDGSPDNCPAICDYYSEKDSRVIVIHKNNGGLSSARNAGLDIAKGEYISFVDSDDILNRDFLFILNSLIESYGCDFSVCKSMSFINKDEIKSTHSNKVAEVFTPDEYWRNKKISETDFVVSWNKMYKKEIFNSLRFPNGKIHEDEFLIHRIVFNSKKIVATNTILYFYRKRSSSIVGNGENFACQCEALIDRFLYANSIQKYQIVKDSMQKFYRYFYRIKDVNEAKMVYKSFKVNTKHIGLGTIGLKASLKKEVFCFSKKIFKQIFIGKYA